MVVCLQVNPERLKQVCRIREREPSRGSCTVPANAFVTRRQQPTTLNRDAFLLLARQLPAFTRVKKTGSQFFVHLNFCDLIKSNLRKFLLALSAQLNAANWPWVALTCRLHTPPFTPHVDAMVLYVEERQRIRLKAMIVIQMQVRERRKEHA